jgi:methionyl-tRNA synthetase
VFPRADKSAAERMQTMEEQGRPATTAVADSATQSSTPPVTTQTGGATGVSRVGASGDARHSTVGTQGPTPKPPVATPDGKISIDDFVKVELRVGVVKVAEKVMNADKLLRLEVDIGTEVRQIVAGIAEAYAPETLVGRKVVIVANLAPRKLRGLESNGMIVAASLEGGQPVLAGFLEDVPVGARLK